MSAAAGPARTPRNHVDRCARRPASVKRAFFRWCALVFGWLLASAHVGTNNVVQEGVAGGYPIRVMISPPGVVPAQVPISIRVLEGTPTRIAVRAAQWNVGTKGAPPAEDAQPVRGEAGLWAHDLWIMTSSTYAVYVDVEGPAGSGTLLVPMQSSSTQTLGMGRVMGGALVVLGGLLVAGVLTIVGAATREGTLAPGQQPSPLRRRAARRAVAGTAAFVALALIGGAKWWNAEEAAYRRSLYRPIESATTVRSEDDARMMTVAITDSTWRPDRFSPVVPDHGKMMHLFLVRAGDQGVIAHLHPVRTQFDAFVVRLPAIPGGRYLLFGDLLLQSGAQRTLVDTVDVPAMTAPAAVASLNPSAPRAERDPMADDPDDAWREMPAMRFGAASALEGGGTLTLSADTTITAERDLRLVATVRNADGSAAELEPYMGMAGHAMVVRQDGQVFMHLHPMGTASMTSQVQLMRREKGDSATLDSAANAAAIAAAESAMDHGSTGRRGDAMASMQGMPAAENAGPNGTLSFPFAFPSAGEYRVFVQVKHNGRIETAAFLTTVPESAIR